ncbi:hypothetical protein F959_00778 [Acinetobacter venetianus RAG-1 = CIP 110063]|uniref:Uncharacterized protein n=1 Tax=Acinetobacter venetianus (strain ATCC 31012 / DSM 23050 / BCRC 14357 / CCUG 45561 / CIP 110063 / KCTC 2702 / LMG 19082 / RAG-1) TaxID=1191460 RepID=N8YMX7_ACIVR|nr:hypothetical protein [Acinetobacter venetianus]ENV38021.1 hypothetical protein F959_00778 [Acinetobacter venetianus RAG-1 = CIP 110063]
MEQNKEELLKHLAASLKDAKDEGGAILLVGAGISVSAGIPPAQKLMKIAIENFPNYFTSEEQKLAQQDLSQLQYNDIMTKLSNVKRKELFKWFIEGNTAKGIEKAKLNFAHIAIAELLKQGYFSRILTVNFDPLLIHACYMVGMYPFPAIYDLGAMGKVNAELLHDPSIVYLNGQHVGFVQRNTTDQLEAHKETLTQIVRSTGCNKTWIVAGYSGENDPLMEALNELRPYNNWLYWLEYSDQVIQKDSHHFLENDEECKVIYKCDADEAFMNISGLLNCSLDFIERPYTELELYTKEINFNTSPRKGHQLLSKAKNYISILKNEIVINKFKLAEIVTDYISNEEFQSFHDDPYYSKEKLISTCEELYPILKDNLKGDFFYWWGSATWERKSLDDASIEEKIKIYEKAIDIYKMGIESDPNHGGNFHFCGYCLLQVAKLIDNQETKTLLLNEAIEYFRDSWDNAEHVMYSIECFILLKDFIGLVDYLSSPQILQITEEYKSLVFQNEYTEPLLNNSEFCAWYKAQFGEEPNSINIDKKYSSA